MEKLKIPLLIVAILVIVYLLYRYLTKISNNTDNSATSSIADNLKADDTAKKESDKTTLDKVKDFIAATPKYTTKLSKTYEGQALYKYYDGNIGTNSPDVGFLSNGTKIGLYNAELRDGEYKRITITSDIILSSYMGQLIVNYSPQLVYGQKTGINLQDYTNGFGFLQDGTMVFQNFVNDQEPGGSVYLHT
jgi:hypothetical protein